MIDQINIKLQESISKFGPLALDLFNILSVYPTVLSWIYLGSKKYLERRENNVGERVNAYYIADSYDQCNVEHLEKITKEITILNVNDIFNQFVSTNIPTEVYKP